MPDQTRHYTIHETFDQGCPVAVLPITQRNRGLHRHDFTELVLVLGGTGRHLTEDGTHPLAAGDAFVVHPGDRHGYQAVDGLEIVNVLYRADRLPLPLPRMSELPGWHLLFALEPRLRGAARGRSRLRLGAGDLRAAAACVGRLEEALRRRELGYQARATILLLELVWLLCRAPSTRRSHDARQAQALAATLARIERACDRPIALAEIEAWSGLRGTSLLRAFRRTTGTTPVDYVIRRRLERAADLLRDTTRPVTTIALDVGFGDSNYFARQFRRVYGCSPSGYRLEGTGGSRGS